MAGVILLGSGNSFEPGTLTTFPANVVPFVNGSQELDYDTNFTYQSGDLGIGTSTLSARLHVKGANDSSGSAAIIGTATYEALRVYNNRQVVVGGGSAFTNTDFTFNTFTTGGDVDTRLVAYFKDSSGDNVMRVHNTPGYSKGGISIYRSSASYAREAFNIYGSTTKYFGIMSNGTAVWPTEAAWPDDSATFITSSSTAGLKGLLFNVVGSSTSGFVFHKGRTTNSVPGTELFMQLYGSYLDNGTNVTQPITMLFIQPTYNFTGAGTVTTTGIDYNPTNTALNGPNYGIRIRSGLSAIGTSATPTAGLMLPASTTAAASLNIPAGSDPTSPNNGDIWASGTDLKIRLGGTTYTITKV